MNLDYLLSGYQWYRRWRGGHWERVFVDVCCSYMWFRQDHEAASVSGARFFGVERLVECESWA